MRFLNRITPLLVFCALLAALAIMVTGHAWPLLVMALPWLENEMI